MREAFALQNVEKMREAAKDSHIFSTKNIGVFEILTFEILTSRLLTTSLVLNNQAHSFRSGGVLKIILR